MMGVPPFERQGHEQTWDVRTKTPHWPTAPLPAGSDCWTNYNGHDRLLTPRQEHEHAQRVGVAEPLAAGERAVIEEIEPGVFEARRAP